MPAKRLAACAVMGAALTAFIALSVPAAAQVVTRPIASDPVTVAQGQLAGNTMASGVRTWFGIPFAAPPVGDLRWREPRAAASWPGVRQAVQFPPMCPQGMRGPGQNHYFGDQATAEDCLYVNVWAPPEAEVTGQKLPVVVWIYGGAFTGGSSAMMWTRGETLAAKGVIYVTLNYRLGALGFMAHPELKAESPHGSSGNYGFLDQVAALQWVKANIGAFGGDADNVTIVGQSAGSMSVAALYASPLTRGLFQRAIGMSGSVFTEGAGSMASAQAGEAAGLALQEVLGATSLADLRRLPADRVIGVRGVRTGPVIDGWFMPKAPSEILAAGEQNDAGLFIGFTRDEAFSPLGGAASAEAYETLVRRTYPADAEALLTAYPADANWAQNARTAARDVSLGVSTRVWASAQTGAGRRPAYAYMFSRVHPYAPGVSFIDHDPATAGAYHAGDLVYWFGNLDAFNAFRTTRNYTPTDRALTDAMSSMIVAFARTGDPSLPGVSVPRYDPANERMVELGDQVRIIDWPGRSHAALLGRLRAAPPAPPTPAAAPPARPADLGANAGPRF
ncbi:carboxylesterase family protein [Rhizobium sp. CRIBSB]|nr:carboxylesterase family protein [Rhizobium sp. CRIBSB]